MPESVNTDTAALWRLLRVPAIVIVLAEALKAYQEIGVSRLVLFTQQIGSEMVDGQEAVWLERLAPVVEWARLL